MDGMKKKSTGKKVVTKKKVAKRVKKEVLLPEVRDFVIPETEKPVVRERVIPILQVEHPPVSPYVISFETEKAEEPTPTTSFEYAPDKSRFEEYLSPYNLDEIVEIPESTPTPTSAPSRSPWRLPRISIIFSVVLNAIKDFARVCTRKLACARVPSLPLMMTFHHFTFQPRFARALASFILIAALFTLPASGLEAYTRLDATRTSFETKSKEAFTSFGNSGISDRTVLLENAHAAFTQARADLKGALGSLSVLAPLIPGGGKYVTSGTSALRAGVHLTEALRIINASATILATEKSPLGARLIHFEEGLRSALPLIRATALDFDRVDLRILPIHLRENARAIRNTIHEAESSLRETVSFFPALQSFLGLETPKRYLVAFQNPHELRPTGGFIGSFAIIDFDKGEIKKLEVPGGGSYDLHGGLRERVVAPAPLHLIEPRWQFHDANWFPDFPTSAQKLMWFYEHSGGSTVNGVIALNATLVPKLLEIVGPIDMPNYGRTFTADNFITETQKIVELEYDRVENKPKAVIGELAPILIERLLAAPEEKLLEILNVVGEAARTKEIQLYASDATVEAVFKEIGIAGDLQKTDGDSLMVVSSNIAGGKSDAVMNTKIVLHTTIGEDGSILNRLDLTRSHEGVKGDGFTGVRNVSYVRVYVPQGSELVEASGFEAPSQKLFSKSDDGLLADLDLDRLVKTVSSRGGMDVTEEFGRMVFGNWMQVDPGQSLTATLVYRLPFTLTDSVQTTSGRLGAFLGVLPYRPYTLLLERQSGLHATFESTLEFPPSWKPRWQTGGMLSGNTFMIHRELDANIFAGLLLDH